MSLPLTVSPDCSDRGKTYSLVVMAGVAAAAAAVHREVASIDPLRQANRFRGLAQTVMLLLLDEVLLVGFGAKRCVRPPPKR